jgi:DNA-binding response OmpR family regulator
MPAREESGRRRGHGRLRLDRVRRRALLDGRDLGLRAKEFDLLAAFAAYPGVALSRKRLLELAWDVSVPVKTRTVDMHVHNLRDRLRGSPLAIETVRGVGYKLIQPPG